MAIARLEIGIYELEMPMYGVFEAIFAPRDAIAGHASPLARQRAAKSAVGSAIARREEWVAGHAAAISEGECIFAKLESAIAQLESAIAGHRAAVERLGCLIARQKSAQTGGKKRVAGNEITIVRHRVGVVWPMELPRDRNRVVTSPGFLPAPGFRNIPRPMPRTT